MMGEVPYLSEAIKEDESLIAYAEDFLKDCREGRVLAFAVACLLPERTITTAYAGDFGTFSMVGALQYLISRLLSERIDDA